MLSTSRAWSCTKQDSGAPVSDASRQLPDGIVFLDKDLAVVVKGVGELCQDNVPQSLSRRMRPVIEAALGHGVELCQCVHRLDQPVSGLCILALTEKSLSALSKAFAQGLVQKTYCAVTERFRQQQDSVENCSPGALLETGEWQLLSCLMVFDSSRKKARIVGPGHRGAKEARLRYKVVGQGDRYDFLVVEPLTGRSHQIRCQLASIGRPIKGDLKYGAKRSERGGGIRLHAYKLVFPHPITGAQLSLACHPPKEDNLWLSCTGFLCR